MSKTTSNDFEKVTSGHEIWSLQIQKLHFYFLRNRERWSHESFRDDRSLDWGCQLGVEHFGLHFRSSLEVKKEIEIFKDNLSNQNIYHIVRSVFKCSIQLTPPEVEMSSHPVISKRSFKFSIFSALNLLYYRSVSLEFNICC
jgi:hypothetical protein